MDILYAIIYTIGFIVYLPVLLLKGKWHRHFLHRFSIWPYPLGTRVKEKNNIWVHAVSVGEVLAVEGLLNQLKKIWPDRHFVISTVTWTGYDLASSRFPQDTVIFAPLDFPAVVYRYIHLIKPKVYIVAETEIWPSLFAALHKRHVPIIFVNGRISENSFRRYSRVKFLLRAVFPNIRWAGMQTRTDADRIIALGIPPERVSVVGNMKFDDIGELVAYKRSALGFNDDDLILIAGSTHPGEEEILLDMAGKIGEEFPNFRLILAPRHIERSAAVAELVSRRGLIPARFSANHRSDVRTIVVVDTIGHLKSLYSIATVVFVGKSLTAHGGQNIIEPAVWGKAVIVGPYTENFRDVMDIFRKAKAVVVADTAEQLKQEIIQLLRDPQERRRLGEAAQSVVNDNRGATEKTVQLLQTMVP